jgi:broad specificity phosphatase PhoE
MQKALEHGERVQLSVTCSHGARLDQADRNWIATAEAPYDTPLSYGGWIQCQALGLRISNELHSLDGQNTTMAPSGQDGYQDGQPRKRRKIVIHSSPYLRCIQTSMAIAAGIQHPQNHSRPRIRSRQKSNLSITEEALETLSATPSDPVMNKVKENTNRLGYNFCKLRIDAFLGEWQSPSYYREDSYPPPSAILVSQAKMALHNPAEEIKGADLSGSVNFNMPEMSIIDEKENEVISTPVQEKTGLRAMAAAGHSFAKRQRNTSFGTELANGARMLNQSMSKPLGYNPPIPNYAVSTSDKIPAGFVAHARDACIDIDFDWDSQDEALDWGDGGPNDEEWAKMHLRFRNGLQKLIAYYECEERAPDEDLVVVLVSHQAGCNALIRLLTGAPALHDVGLSSLSMAVRSERMQTIRTESPSPTKRRGSLDMTIAEDYDMKIIASTEHLRAGSNPLGLNSPRLGKSPAFASRRAVGADSPEGLSLGESLAPKVTGSMMPARSASARGPAPDDMESSEPVVGLWRRGSQYSRDDNAKSIDAAGQPAPRRHTRAESLQESFPVFSGDNAQTDDTAGDRKSDSHLIPTRSASQRGLWGGESLRRARSPGKRRWTAVEKSP